MIREALKGKYMKRTTYTDAAIGVMLGIGVCLIYVMIYGIPAANTSGPFSATPEKPRLGEMTHAAPGLSDRQF